MADHRAKFDAELRDIQTSFLDIQRGDRDRVYPLHSAALHGGPVSPLMQFGGDLAGIEARGFRTEWVEDHFARGDIELADLDAVASHPQVIQLEYGSRLKPALNTSAPEIRARGTSLVDAVWTVNTTTGAFSGNEGAEVLIGVIDTGIDITHPVFLKPGSTNTTRILRIWDMGIGPHDGILSPDVSLIQGNFTYGIEYTDALINNILQKKPSSKPVKHRDCFGHGTHVASIAAGNGSAPRAKKKYEFVGVASAADLIVVKMFYLFQDPEQNGVALSFERLLEDAISYVQRVAKNVLGGRPVVINASLGAEIGPHDGLSPSDLRIEALFRNAAKVALVAAAGNEADPSSRQHAVITMPASGTIDVPFTLYDERTVTADKAHCSSKPRGNAAPQLEIQFWYRQLGPQQTLTCAITLPGAKVPTPGPTLGNDIDGNYRTNQPFHVTHEADATQRPPATTPLTRNVLRIKVTPNGNNFGTGRFTLRLNAPAGTIIHAWGQQNFPPHGFRIGHDKPKTQPAQMLPLPRGIAVTGASTLSYPGTSAGAITVASYNDVDSGHAIADDSSQGPLVDYSGSGSYVAKPDLAAPGVQIMAAISGAPALRDLLGILKGAQYTEFSGTSMATPHVSGVAALMLEKNNNLARADLVKKLKDHARSPQQPDVFGAGRVDAKASRDAV